MKKNRKKKNKRKIVIFISCLILLLFYILFVRNIEHEFIIFKYSKSIVLQFEEKITKLLYKPNKLIIDNTVLESKLENLQYENQLLKKELKLNDTTKLNLLNAIVINRNIDNWFNNITIDKGEKDGVIIGSAVINSNGLIGIIDKVYNNHAMVELLSSNNISNISVGVKGVDGYNHGIIKSFENNLIVVSGLTNYDFVYENAKVVTTGINNLIPAGLLIGYVSHIENDKYDISKLVYVKSNQNFDDIRYVAIVMR